MSADFWAGYVSGAVGILVGNPLDLIKTRLQAGNDSQSNKLASQSTTSNPIGDDPKVTPSRNFNTWTSYARGAAAPILGYGALNALLFVTYNRTLSLLTSGNFHFGNPGATEQLELQASGWKIWTAGAVGGLATFVVSAPTELVKCRAQVAEPARSSWEVFREVWRDGGLRGLYAGGAVTSLRDGIGYGFYFWSYHLSKQALAREGESDNEKALKVLLCGGLAGIVTWASVFPLDVIKTRVQTYDLHQSRPQHRETSPLLRPCAPAAISEPVNRRPSTLQIARHTYHNEGVSVFFRGLGVCSARAFIVNAIQWAIYEWIMRALAQ